MAVANDPVTMIGDFKNLYKDSGLVNAIPSWMIVQQRFPFEEAEAGLGQFYVFGVVLQKEQGFTYAPSSGANSGVQTLNAAVAGYIGQAQVEGFAIYLRSRLSYDAAAKASKAGKKAFAQAYGAVLKNMKESHQFRLECSLLYGRDGLGIVGTNSGGGVFLLTAASWAIGVWASGMKGAVLEVWTGTTATETQRNGDMTLSAISVANQSITVTGTSSAVAPNDVIYFKGARTATTYNECIGIYRILTFSGNIFNIDNASYDLWAAQSYPVNGNLSLTAVMNAAAAGMPFGLEKAILLCAPTKFAQLASDEAALRRYVSDTSKTNRGVKGISFMMGQVDVEILPHPLLKAGDGFMLADDSFHRVGSTDVTFALPGSNEQMSVQVTDSTAIEMRSMSDQGIYSETPAQCVYLSAIA